MNFKNNISTTREQSRRLLALGVKPETADCYIECAPLGKDFTYIIQSYNADAFKKSNITPSWSLARLLEMMPEYIMDGSEELKFKILYPTVGYFYIENEHYYSDADIFDNCVNMIAWLVERGYFNQDYLKHSNSSKTGKELRND